MRADHFIHARVERRDRDALDEGTSTHLTHAAEVLGYYHPDHMLREAWLYFYKSMCRKLHLNLETREELDARLLKGEEDFARAQ